MKVRKAVFPVAGLGTRFLPATKAIPKEMLPVLDRPVIEYAVQEAWDAGIEMIIFVTGRGKGALADHFDHVIELEETLRAKGNDAMLQQLVSALPREGTLVQVRQKQPLGLGHAVWCARHLVGDEPFAVLLPDDLVLPPVTGPQAGVPVLQQMVDRFETYQSSIIAVADVPRAETRRYGVIAPQESGVQPDGTVALRALVEKPHPDQAPSTLAIIGRYILTPEVFGHLEHGRRGAGGEIQLTDALMALLDGQSMYGYQFSGSRFDCGDKVGFQMANLEMALRTPDIHERLLPQLRARLAQI
jgi:UTP--glucose-1-phosphate uridylyltransferase